MSLIVVHSRTRKKHVANETSRSKWGDYLTACYPPTLGYAGEGNSPSPYRSAEDDPWCKKCEKRARKEGLIP